MKHSFRSSFFFLGLLALYSDYSRAYPQFIGHGYTTCITCHYSPTGGGGLNDYGRALFAAEIARKPFWDKKVTDEELANSSGFLGSRPLPYWIRPAIKYRRLLQVVNPGSSQEREGDYRMQMDLNLALFPDPSQSKGLILTLSHLARPQAALPNRPISHDMEDFAMREYFWRQPLSDTRWLSAGFMDKPFGIRHADHTAVNRTTFPVAQNDQVHGVMYSQYNKSTEFHVMPYAGNLHRPGNEHYAGISGIFEYEPIEKIRYGVSAMYEERTTDPLYGLSTHAKIGLNNHSAWLVEGGLRRAQEWTPFLCSQMTFFLTRGVYLEPTLQLSQTELTSSGVRRTRTGLGLLFFPFQRLEFRTQLIYSSLEQQDSVGDDSWVAQAQLHLSL